MSRVRLVPIVVIAIVALAVLFGGWQAYEHFNLLNPLKQTLQQVEGVQTVNISTGSPDSVEIQLGPFNKLKNGDLQQTYDDISHKISSRLGTGVSLDFTDKRDPELSRVLEQNYEPILYEGIAKGNYTEMIAQVTKMAKQSGIDAIVTMDGKNIYIQLSKGNHYLYKVMPYSTHQGGASS